MRLIFAFLFIFLYFPVYAQERPYIRSTTNTAKAVNINCPQVETINPPKNFKLGEVATYGVKLTGEVDIKKIIYEWEVENLTIISGNGTSTVQIATNTDLDKDSTKIKLRIVGFDERCRSMYYEATLGKSLEPPKPILFEEFGVIPAGGQRSRLDGYMIELQNNIDSQGYIINFGSPKDITMREKLIRNHWNFRMYDSPRIVYVNGGFEKTIRTRLWIVPQGADASLIN